MREFAELLIRDEDVMNAILREMPLGTSVEHLRLYEDPDVNWEVYRVLKRVEQRLVKAENDRLVDQFRILCANAGIELKAEDPVDSVETQVSEGPLSLPRLDEINVATKASTPETVRFARALDITMESRVRHIKSGKVKTEILAEGEEDRALNVGDTVLLNCGAESLHARVLSVSPRYRGFLKLTSDGIENLSKWYSDLPVDDNVDIATREFSRGKYKDKKLVVFDFELV